MINSNLNLSANNSILAQYQASSMSDVLSSTNNQNQQLAYLKTVNDLANSNPNKVTLDPIADNIKQWDDTTRGLTGASQAIIAVSAVAIAIGTGGIGSGLSGAMITAGATAAGTQATISATNASMNTDSSIIGSTKSITSKTWRDTTSDESLRNIAIAAAVAGVGYGIGEWMKAKGVNPSLESGTAENSKVGVNVEKVDRRWRQPLPKGGFKEVSSFEAYTVGNQNPAFQTFNTTPGAPPFAGFHDAMNFPVGVNQVTIAPYYAMSQCAAAPTLCAMFPDTFIKVGTWGQVNTNLDINKNNYGQQSN